MKFLHSNTTNAIENDTLSNNTKSEEEKAFGVRKERHWYLLTFVTS